MEAQSLVDQPEFHRGAPLEPPVDVHVLPACGGVAQHPANLPAGRRPIHHRHRAAPLDGCEVDRVELQQALRHRREPPGLQREDERLVRGTLQECPVRLELARRRGIAPQGGEARAQVLPHLLRRDVNRAERVHFREEAAEQMVDSPYAIDQRNPSRPVESHEDDVALRRSDDHAFDPRLALERAGIRCGELHARTWERQVHGTRIRRVGQEEADHLAAPHYQSIVGLAVHEEQVAEPTHERVRGRLPAEGDRS